jgi:hypothetical protein
MLPNIVKFCVLSLLACSVFAACRSSKSVKQKPAWVYNRPVNEAYYIGIGIASKTNNPTDYQQVAKKNAVNDLISEIKVTVSSHSVLSQLQHNKAFTQQFESDVKVTAINTIEQFTVVDSWEDNSYFWIYYKLSKNEYHLLQRKKMMAAVEQAEHYFIKSESLGKEQFVQQLRLKLKALATLQLYLNEDIQIIHNQQQVYLVNELMSSIQNQLYEVELVSDISHASGKVGRPIQTPFDIRARYRDSKIPIAFLPLTTRSDHQSMEGTLHTETDQQGIASLSISKIKEKAPVQLFHILTDISSIGLGDSINQTLQLLLGSIDLPNTFVRVMVVPIKIFVESKELNLSQKMPASYIDVVMKKWLSADGCSFVASADSADYILTIDANTKAEGIIWGNMRTVALDMSISLVDQQQHIELFKDGFRQIKGFQTTDINAGLDAYKTATDLTYQKIYPTLKKELMSTN